MSSACFDGVGTRLAPRDPPEHSPRHQSRTARIVEVEEPANEFARSVEARDRRILDVEHMRRRIDLQPAKRKRNPASNRIGFKWRLLDRVGPVCFVDRQSIGALAVLDVGIEFDVASTAVLYSWIVFRKPAGLTSCIRLTSSSRLSARTLVAPRSLYSPRSKGSVCASNTCQA